MVGGSELTADAAGELTGPLLKQVSRSFYLSLAVLPAGVRPGIGLAYLLARATDTIADTRIVPRETRLDPSVSLLRVDPPVTVGVQQLQVVERLQAPETTPPPMVDVPRLFLHP